MSAAIQNPGEHIVSIAEEARGLVVKWSDGHVSLFHYVWLRDNCYCETCGETMVGVRFLRVHDLDLAVRPKSAQLDNHRDLNIAWQPDGHPSCYPAEWLRRHCYSDTSRSQRRHQPVLWDERIMSSLPWFEVERLAADESQRMTFLETVGDLGFALLRGVDMEEKALAHAVELAGPVQMGVYGPGAFELNPRSSRRIIGNTHHAVPPHTDEGYRQHPSGIIFIACDIPSADGEGKSVLVDGFKVAEQLREEDPEAFELLSTVTLPFHRVHPNEMDLRALGRVFCLDSDGNLVGVRYPARNAAPLDVPPELVEPVYRALWQFSAGINDPRNEMKLRLEHGECKVFDNHRVFHGREAFSGERRMLLTSVNRQDFHSTVRLLAKKLGREGYDRRLPAGVGH